MVSILQGGRARIVVTTCGTGGAILVRRQDDSEWDRIRTIIASSGKPSTVIAPGLFDSVLYETKETTTTTTANVFGASFGSVYKIIQCPIWPHDLRRIVDSTGAGDAFIGGKDCDIIKLSFGSLLLHSFVKSKALSLDCSMGSPIWSA